MFTMIVLLFLEAALMNGINIVSVHVLCLMGKVGYRSQMRLTNIHEKMELEMWVQITEKKINRGLDDWGSTVLGTLLCFVIKVAP